ncbi:hypothetical protein ACFWV1_11285 [Streptomyces sp. NPDC058700]
MSIWRKSSTTPTTPCATQARAYHLVSTHRAHPFNDVFGSVAARAA